jgi:hypothetical protein
MNRTWILILLFSSLAGCQRSFPSSTAQLPSPAPVVHEVTPVSASFTATEPDYVFSLDEERYGPEVSHNIYQLFRNLSEGDPFIGSITIPPGETLSANNTFGPYGVDRDFIVAGPTRILGAGASNAISAFACVTSLAGLPMEYDMRLAYPVLGLPDNCESVDVWMGPPTDRDVRITNPMADSVTIHFEQVDTGIHFWTSSP